MIAKDETRKEFLSVLGHELRNPLATILSSIELMNSLGVDSKEVPKLLTVVTEQVHLMARSLDDLLKVPNTPTKISAADSLKVLIVDDNIHAADSLGRLLALRGYQVEVEYGGAGGFKKAVSFRPDVAIFDIGMPEIDGYELSEMLHKENIPCIYIALTGYAQAHDKEKALRAGFDIHLTKPANVKAIEEVLRKVRTGIRGKSA